MPKELKSGWRDRPLLNVILILALVANFCAVARWIDGRTKSAAISRFWVCKNIDVFDPSEHDRQSLTRQDVGNSLWRHDPVRVREDRRVISRRNFSNVSFEMSSRSPVIPLVVANQN